MTSFPTEDYSRFLLPQHKTLGRRLFEDVSVVRQDQLTTQNANVVDLEDRRHAVDCQSDMLLNIQLNLRDEFYKVAQREIGATQGRIKEFARGGPVPPVPFLSPFLSLSPLPSLSFPLEVGLLKSARGSGGAM